MNARPDFASLGAGLLARKGEAAPALSDATKTMADIGIFSVPVSVPGFPDGKRDDTAADRNQKGVATGPGTQGTVGPRRVADMTARVSFSMPMADYLRLKMAGQLLDTPCRTIVLEALRRHLYATGIADLSDCPCLKADHHGGEV